MKGLHGEGIAEGENGAVRRWWRVSKVRKFVKLVLMLWTETFVIVD